MRYSEFEREVRKLGYKAEDTDSAVRLKDSYGMMVAEINKKHQYRFDTEWDMDIKEELFNLIVELAETAPEYREEEKKYYVKLPKVTRDSKAIYLLKQSSSCANPTTVDWSNEHYIKSGDETYRFTEKEIKEIDERYWPFAEEVK